MTDQEDRLTRLEETIFFQDRLIADLNSVLTSQQGQLDNLERDMESLRLRLKIVLESLDEEGPANVPPPHYL